jgi:hypothetical protein
MHEIQQAAGRVVATDTQNSVDAVDQAVMSLAHLCASIIEVSKASRLPIATAQGALANAGDGLAKLIASREDMAQATRELTSIQKASTLRTVAFGCPPLPASTGHLADVAPAKQNA